MTVSELQPVVVILSTLISIGTAIYLWLTSGSRANAGQIAALAERQTALERRVDALASDMRHVPDKDATQRLELSLAQVRGEITALSAEMGGKLAAMTERIAPIAAATGLVHEFLVEQAKNR